MASTSPTPLDFSNEKLDLESIQSLVNLINQQLHSLIEDTQKWKSLKSNCTSKLNIQTHEFLEFSEYSLLSNLYWGVEGVEEALLAKSEEDKTLKLQNSEKLLQGPASLDENGVTLGFPNSYLVCSSYFYLSIVEKLRKNTWQSAMHFLQALLVAPRLVQTELVPGVYQNLFMFVVSHEYEETLAGRGVNIMSLVDFDDDKADDAMRWIARNYKPWLMYYQIISGSGGEIVTSDTEPPYETIYAYSTHSNKNIFQSNKELATYSNQSSGVSSNLKCVKDILTESQSDTCSCNKSSVDECFPEYCAEDLDEVSEKKLHLYNYIDSMSLNKCSSRTKRSSSLQSEGSFHVDQTGLFQKMISKLCFTEQLENCEEDYTVETKTIYKLLNNKSGLKYSILKDAILDQLLVDISTSKEEQVVRASVSILSTIVSENKSVMDDVKKKGLQLYDLATALKRNVHEAVVLIYLINPSPAEIKTLELLPCLVEVVCKWQSYKVGVRSLVVTPPAASLMIIEVLVTAFDCETNNMHVAAISSRRVLTRLLHVPRQDNLGEFVSLASVLVKCMRFDGQCRKYILESSPVAPFVSLLWSNQKRATHVALEFFHELLRMPRSSAINLLKQIQKEGSLNTVCALSLLIKNSDLDYKLLAANLLLQLEILEDVSAECVYREQAMDVLLESVLCEENTITQSLSAFILSNLGGTYSWTGESYTSAWLVKKSGLTSLHHKNMIRNCDFLDQSLQDCGIEVWCSKSAQCVLNSGTSIFHALEKGLKSKSKRVSRDCLVAIAWLGCEVAKCPKELRNSASEILLNTLEQYVHPGLELEERLLACLSIYNYTSGRGMKKIINLSEGVRESLRRLSNVTWMAEELLKVADYFQPNKWRISCVHRHVLEAGRKGSGAVTALIYYKGQLHSGHADGSIKVWSIKGQTATLVEDIKEHKKAVTCFSLYEPGNCLLSGSADKTMKIWQMVQRKLECIEVIPTKESIRSIDSWGELIFATTQSHKLKVVDASRKVKDILKSKHVKCITIVQGKVYAGCKDSSILELVIMNNRQQEIKAPSKSWMQNKPINSVTIYKDCLYSASLALEGSKIKDWRKGSGPQLSVLPEKGASILAMEVVEDFIYLNCSTSMNNLQIWLRGSRHRVGRLSASSKITSLLSANDMILCGTETGLIKGWIPL